MPISRDEVRWVAQLARLAIGPDELDRLVSQLGAVLDYVEQLNQVDTAGIEPLAHPFEIHSVFRPDEPAPSLTAADALANAPQSADGFFLVPPVFGDRQP